MTETILSLLTRLSEAGQDATLSGSAAQPFLGPGFDRLLRRRVLVEQAPLAEWDSCSDCDCGVHYRPIRREDTGYRANCPMDPRDDVILTSEDIRSFSIDVPNLAREIASATGLLGTPDQFARDLWLLGETAVGRAVCLVLEPKALTTDGLVPIIRRYIGTGPLTLLTPKPPVTALGMLTDAEIHVVETLELVRQTDGAMRMKMLETASEQPELSVFVASATMEWRGYRVTWSHQLFPVFHRLVEKALSRDPVASGPYLEDATGREAKDLVRELRGMLRAAGLSEVEAKQLVATVRGRGYRLNVAAAEIDIQD